MPSLLTSSVLPLLAVAAVLLPCAGGCGGVEGSETVAKGSGDEAGARALVERFLAPDADRAALTAALEPSAEDYDAVFVGDAAKRAREGYAELWSTPVEIGPKEGQSEVLLSSATTEELRAWTGPAVDFPGGYKDAAAHLEPGLRIYRFKFVAPGEELGMAFDGLVHVGGRWRLFPKPWKHVQ